jgi:hypothetical protein
MSAPPERFGGVSFCRMAPYVFYALFTLSNMATIKRTKFHTKFAPYQKPISGEFKRYVERCNILSIL